jgi:hypothetical protein
MAQMPLDVTWQSAAYVHPMPDAAWGTRISLLSVTGLKGYDDGDAPTGDVKAQDSVMSFGYGRRLLSGGAGVSVKQVRQSIATKSASVWAVDAGWIRPLGRLFRGSVAVRNVGGKATFVDQSVGLPRLVDLGMAFRGFHGAVNASAEMRQTSDGRISMAAGAEVWSKSSLAFRAGYDAGRDLGGVSVGFGFRTGGLRIDYAFLPKGQGFDPTHRVSVCYRFRSPGERAHQEGLALSQQGRHAEAIYKFKEALDEDPSLSGVVQDMRASVDALERQMEGNKR